MGVGAHAALIWFGRLIRGAWLRPRDAGSRLRPPAQPPPLPAVGYLYYQRVCVTARSSAAAATPPSSAAVPPQSNHPPLWLHPLLTTPALHHTTPLDPQP